MTTYKLGDKTPAIHDSVYIADAATVIGDVDLHENASVWSGAVLRGDNERISVGAGSNIQEGAVLHTDPGFPLVIEQDVSVGHQAMLHGCTVGAGSLIGIQAIILNGAVIGRNCLVAAGALVTEGKIFPDNSLIIGAPAKVHRELDAAAIDALRKNALDYVARGSLFKASLCRIDDPLSHEK